MDFIEGDAHDRIFVPMGGRLVPVADAYSPDQRKAFDRGWADTLQAMGPAPFAADGAPTALRAGVKGVSWTRRAQRRALQVLAQQERAWGAQDAAGAGGPAGAVYPQLVGQMREQIEQPRPAPLFRVAFPDPYPFRPGEVQVQGTVHVFAGKPGITRGTVSDIPKLVFGTVSVIYNTFYLLLGVDMTFIEQQQAGLGPGMLDMGARTNKALAEVDLAMDQAWWEGDAAAGVDGILANPCVLRYRDADIDLSTDTGDAIVAHFALLADYVRENSQGSQSVDTVILAVAIERALERPMSSSDSTPILERVEALFKRRGIIVLRDERGWYRLRNAGGTGYHGALFYNRKRPNSAPRPLLSAEPMAVPTDRRWPVTQMAVWAQAGDVHTDGRDLILAELYVS